MNTIPQNADFLRFSLRGNAVFSFVSGLVFSIAHRPIAGFIGINQPAIILVIGISLLAFAIGLFINSKRKSPNRLEARIAVTLDLIWVAASPVVVALGLLTSGGNWATIIIADIVLAFAILQLIGLRRMNSGSSDSNQIV